MGKNPNLHFASIRAFSTVLQQADCHTLLRLPTGIFYAQGVKANVLFFDRKPAQENPWTQKLWIYDLRTNQHFTLKENTLKREHLDEFVACYQGRAGSPLPAGKGAERSPRPTSRHDRKESERFKTFTYDELTKRDKANLDIFWLKDEALEDSANLPAPGIIWACETPACLRDRAGPVWSLHLSHSSFMSLRIWIVSVRRKTPEAGS